MVLTQIGVVVGTVLTLLLTSRVMSSLGRGATGTMVAQFLVVGGSGYYLFSNDVIGVALFTTIMVLPIVFAVAVYFWFAWLSRKVLDGSYGVEAQWAGELVREEDREFIDAVTQLDQMTIREIGIMSDSKEELRERTIDEAASE